MTSGTANKAKVSEIKTTSKKQYSSEEMSLIHPKRKRLCKK